MSILDNDSNLGLVCFCYACSLVLRGGSRISEEGVQMYKRGAGLPNFQQNLLIFSMKME